MFHAMRFAMGAEDGSAPVPATRTWFRARGPFVTSGCESTSETPYAVYNGRRMPLVSAGRGVYAFSWTEGGTTDVVSDDDIYWLTFADPDAAHGSDFAPRLLDVFAIGTKVVDLGRHCFYRCRALGPVFEPLYYGAGIRIGSGCFEECSGIKSFSPRFLSKVVSSGERSFAKCTSLESIDGMSAFNPAADYSFYGCKSLVSLVGGYSGNVEFGRSCFEGCSSLVSLLGVPDGLSGMGNACFRNCVALSDLGPLASTVVDYLPDRCFEGCASLKSVAGVPASVENIGARCFADSGVESLAGLPGRLTAMYRECFSGCERLSSLDGLPVSVVYGPGMFMSCYGEDNPEEPVRESREWGLSDLSALSSLDLDSLGIPDMCFYGDQMIRRIPDLSRFSTVDIGSYAFSGCSGLDAVSGLPEKTELREGAFARCYRPPHTWHVAGASGSAQRIETTMRYCGMSSADLSNLDTESLPASCFEGCVVLTELPKLPPATIELGDRCFCGCEGMKSLQSLADLAVSVSCGSTYYDDGVLRTPKYPRFGEWCFSKCGVIDKVTVEGEVPGSLWYFNDPGREPEVGKLESLRGLKDLCDRLEAESVSVMKTTSSGSVLSLIGMAKEKTCSRFPDIVEKSVFETAGPDGKLWGASMDDLVVAAGLVENLSKISSSGCTVVFGMVSESLSYSTDHAPHVVIALIYRSSRPEGGYEVSFLCLGFEAPVLTILAEPGFTGEHSETVRGPVDTEHGGISANVRVSVNGGIIARIDVEFLRVGVPAAIFTWTNTTSGATGDPPGTPEELAKSFLELLIYQMLSFAAGSGDRSDVAEDAIGAVFASFSGRDALDKLRELNLATPAEDMLSSHCFDGCTSLKEGFPALVASVPSYCFSGTGFQTLAEFSHVYDFGVGAFSKSGVESLAGFPENLKYVSDEMFDGCESIASLDGLPRTVSVFGAKSFRGCVSLESLACPTGGLWDDDSVRKVLRNVTGTDDDFTAEYPMVMFESARSVTGFGRSCFQGCTSLTDSSFKADFVSPSSDLVYGAIREAARSVEIHTISPPWASSGEVEHAMVFRVSSGCSIAIRFTEHEPGPFERYAGFDMYGRPSGDLTPEPVVSSVSIISSSQDISVYPGPTSNPDRYVIFPEGSRGEDYQRRLRSDPFRAAVPFPGGSFSGVVPSGYVGVFLDAYGKRYAVEFSLRVERTINEGLTTSANAYVRGVRITDMSVKWPGYPDAGESAGYSVIPCLSSVGESCFEGCTGLSTLEWVPFNLKRFSGRCFAGVPFSHPVDPVPEKPEFSGWSTPTVDRYRNIISRMENWEYFSMEVDQADRPSWIRISAYGAGEDDYVQFNLGYEDSDDGVVVEMSVDPGHAETVAIVRADEPIGDAELDLGRTTGLSGTIVAGVATTETSAFIRIGDVRFMLLPSVGESGFSVSFKYGWCPRLDAMERAVQNLRIRTAVEDRGDGWTWGLSTNYGDVLVLEADRETGTWAAESVVQVIPSGSDASYELRLKSFSSTGVDAGEVSAGRYWFRAVSDDYGAMDVYANVKVTPVKMFANSVVVPSWIDSIGSDCFSFRGFEDSQEKLEALYLHRTKSEIQSMSGFPWGVPPGCRILSVTGGVVYTSPQM